MSRANLLVTLLAVLALAGLGYWSMQHLEKKEIKLPTGLQGEAKANSLLAAERFLTQAGLRVEHVDNSDRMLSGPAPDDVVIITSDRQTLGAGRTRALLDWVERGGHLVVTVMRPAVAEAGQPAQAPPRDPLLETLGLRTIWADEDLEDDEYEYAQVSLPPLAHPMRVAFDPSRVLTGMRSGDRRVPYADGALLVTRNLGQGRVTVAVDLGVLEYRRIGEFDHALFLWDLVAGAGKVWLVSDNDLPPLWLWAWSRAPQAMVSGALLLLLWMWSRARRFGPLLGEPPPVRRRLLEHIEANGRLLWRHHRQQHLLQAVRDELTTTAARRHPAWSGMSEAERSAHIAGLSGLDGAQVRSLLHDPPARSRQDFVHAVRQLETIRKTL
jgi:hypothetical protein